MGWINDMFSAGPDTGIYPGPGAPADVETDEGTAHIVGLGGPVHELSFIESLISLFYVQISNLQFGYCAADVDALLAAELTASTGTLRQPATEEGRRHDQSDAAVGGCGRPRHGAVDRTGHRHALDGRTPRGAGAG